MRAERNLTTKIVIRNKFHTAQVLSKISNTNIIWQRSQNKWPVMEHLFTSTNFEDDLQRVFTFLYILVMYIPWHVFPFKNNGFAVSLVTSSVSQNNKILRKRTLMDRPQVPKFFVDIYLIKYQNFSGRYLDKCTA